MTLESTVRRYLLVAASLFVMGLFSLAVALLGGGFGPWLNREALLVGGLSLMLAGGWQLWTLAGTQLRVERQSRAMASELEMMAGVAQHTGSAVLVSDSSHRVLWGNEAFTRVTGYSLDEIRGKQPGPMLRSPKADPATLARLEEAMRDFTSLDIEILHRYKDGRDRWVRMLLSPLQENAADLPTGFVAVLVDIEAQVQTREALRHALRDNEALMQTLNQHAIVSETDPEGIITRVNRGFVEISGYSEAELLGQHHRIVNSRMHPSEFWAGMWASISRGQSWSDEICNRTKDGRLYWVHSLIVPFVGNDGRVEKYISIRLDITARKRAEEQLRTSQELLARTSRIAGIGGWYADLRTRSLYLSDECRTILRLEPGQAVVLEDLWRHFEPEAGEKAREQLQAMARMELLSVDLVAHMQGGQPGQAQWVRLVAEMDWQGGDSERMVGAVQDITFQIRTQQRIEEEQRILRGAIDALGEGFVLFDPDDRLVYCNDKYREIYAPIQEHIFVGAFYENIVRAATAVGIFKQSLEDQEGWVRDTLELHRSQYSDRIRERYDGRWLRIIESRTVDNYHVGFRLDVTALQNALLAADAAARSKGQFLANMSHEIRTPINAIMGLLQLLSYTPLDRKQGDLVHKARTAARSLLDILNDILDYSKVEAGKMELHPEPFEVEQLLRELSVILSGALGEKKLDLVYDVDPHIPPMLVGDALRLKQVLINLGGNAIKFTALGGVRVGLALVRQEDGRVRIRFSVQDTGIGISPEQQQHIFNGFSQAEASIARRFGGTGLGLAISQRLVALMDSELRLDSTPGVGSVFSFEVDFPVAPLKALSRPAVAPGGPSGRRLDGLRLLLVEDNVLNQEVARAMLEREGARVVLADNGQKAVDALAQDPDGYDLVLMDVQMPVLDGLQATQVIRSRLQLTQLPIVAMTANAMQSDREQTAAAGMDAHIGKPFDIDELVAQILQLTGRSVTVLAAGDEGHEPALVTSAAVLENTAALRRLGGDAALLQRLRGCFAGTVDELLRRMHAAVARADWGGAAGLVHQLKGSAAAVGAEVLARTCAPAEELLRAQAGAGGGDEVRFVPQGRALDAALGALDAVAGELQPALAHWLQAQPVATAAPAGAGVVTPALLADLQTLKSLLDQADIEAVELHEQLLARQPVAHGALFAPLNALMEAMDLPAAAREAGELLRRLQSLAR